MPAAHAALEPFPRPRTVVRRTSDSAPSHLALVAAYAPEPAAAPPRRATLNNPVIVGAGAMFLLCAAIEIAPWVVGGAAIVAAAMLAVGMVVGAAVFAWRYVSALRDETVRLRRELGIAREAERWHRAVLDEVAEAVLVASPEGRLLETNQAAWRLLGRTREEISGRRLWDLLPLDDRLVALRRGEHVSTHGGGLRRLLRPDGTAVLADVSWSTLADGRVIYLARPFK
ncbi:MAG TPA: PAS domain-containing protein [Longimicrobiaceae bacterium]